MSNDKAFGQVAGGRPKALDAKTVAEARLEMAVNGDHTALVDGKPADDSTALKAFDIVTFAPKVKGN